MLSLARIINDLHNTDISFSKNDAKITFKSQGIEKEILTKSIILASGLENKLINKLNINSIKNAKIIQYTHDIFSRKSLYFL